METTTDLATTLAQVDPELQQAKHRWIIVNFALIGIIVVLGLCLNFLAMAVFIVSPALRATTSARYFIALCAADNINLLGELLRWLNAFDEDYKAILGITFEQTNHFCCFLIYFFRYYGKFASIWLTVAITIERFLVATFPLRVSTLSTKRTTNIVICGIYLLGFALNVPVYWTLYIYEGYYCSVYRYYDSWNRAVNVCGTLAIPYPLIFLFTCLLLCQLHRLHRDRMQLTSNSDSSGIQRQLTAMLLTVAITTIVFRLPYTIMYQIYMLRSSIWSEDIHGTWFEFRLVVVKELCYIPVVLNYTINFFLFYITGSIFRKNLVSCMKCEKAGQTGRSKSGQQTRLTMMTNTSSYSNQNLNIAMTPVKGPKPRNV